MDPLLKWARKNQSAVIELIREFVECESPSDSPSGIHRLMNLLHESINDIAVSQLTPAGAFLCKFRLPGRQKKGCLLALGHADTVWPIGTLATMPFRRARGRLWGPGVLDMKAGLAFFVFAMRALVELDIPVPNQVVLLVNPDEETGSRNSRAGTETVARQSNAILVLEPGTGLEGKAKTARKGIGAWTLKVRGVASHAGVDFAKGASAVVELARQDRGDRRLLPDLDRGITVNPGVISGGTRSNVIAAEASAEIDFRVPLSRRRERTRSQVPLRSIPSTNAALSN